MAVSIKPSAGQPTVGVIYLRASTDANLECGRLSRVCQVDPC
jgi:hypothetical protein